MSDREKGFATRAIHAGQEPDRSTGATIVPIYQTSTYTQEAPGRHKGYEYSRTGNPTRSALEQCVAALEGAEHGLAFASGLAATTAVMSLLSPGDHVVAGDDLYGGSYRLFDKVLQKSNGLDFTFVDTTDPGSVEAALRPETKMLWIETPTNPMLTLSDIALLSEMAHGRGATVAVDNTFASPYFQQPLALGADIVVHSTTKYMGGHSDVVGGAAVTSDSDLRERMAFYQNAAGGVPGPFDSWIVLRGLKTLAVRMRQHEENALAVARYLQDHPQVATVNYPGLPTHPQHDLAKRQMSGFSGMVSFTLKGGTEAAHAAVQKTEIFHFAESLGGVESLITHPASMTHAAIPKEQREARGVTDGLLRLSVGIEDEEDLVADLERAIS
ncbi:cystathionine gamma-synthase [Rubrobacter tropicus]|uniref:Cystathionine gamma-synthase n=1 Tax=Rubrobacter tropicus TaxID=2653851 RepID=A0A6G8Q4S4_9ACTN|nr:cystathionine gamma-synthase [Rubrobacter tropicus]QIN81443.1 cystathionine gamma-synthase [Rubrobacter tropicus]